MGLKDLMAQMRGLKDQAFEDQLYRQVWEEIQQGRMDPVAQAKSVEDGRGDDGLVRSAYIKHRVRRLRYEIEQRKEQELQESLRRKEAEAQRIAEEERHQKEEMEAQRIAEKSRLKEAGRRSSQQMAEERRSQGRRAEAEAQRIAEEVLRRRKQADAQREAKRITDERRRQK